MQIRHFIFFFSIHCFLLKLNNHGIFLQLIIQELLWFFRSRSFYETIYYSLYPHIVVITVLKKININAKQRNEY